MGQGNVRGLEIGAFEGLSTCWLMDHVFTNPTSHLDVVDTFQGSTEHKGLGVDTSHLYETFLANTSEFKDHMSSFRMTSQHFLLHCCRPMYDFIYVDGDHHAWSCLEDMVLSWSRLKVYGIMIIDDYGGGEPGSRGSELVKTAVDGFMASYESKYNILHKKYQVILQKI